MLTFILAVTCVLNLSVALLTLVALRHRSAVTSDEAVASSPTRTAESRPSAPVISQKSGPASGHIGGVANGRDTETHAALHTLTAAAGELVAAHQNLLLQAETLFVRHSGDDLRLVLNAFVEATRTWNDAHHSATNSRLDAIDRRLVEITYQTQVLLQLLRHAQSLVSKSDMAVALEVTTSSNNGTVDTPAREPEVYTSIQSDGLHEDVEVASRPEGPTDGHAQTEAAGLAIADGEQEPSLLRDFASEENQ